jgi:hypothetical protein
MNQLQIARQVDHGRHQARSPGAKHATAPTIKSPA